jgi:YidC/Oxa1 family membrane protein insertase
LQKKYAKDKDKEKLQKEQSKLLRESGVNPAGCMFTQFIQFPVWIGIYQSVIQGIAVAPENLLGLSKQLYGWSFIQEAVPLNSSFLWFDLGKPDIAIAILGGLSMWLLQRMSMSPAVDSSQQSTQNTVQILMPVFFIVFGLVMPSGLPLYWVASSVIRGVMQYRATGWGGLRMPAFVGKVFPRLASVNAGNTSASGGAVVKTPVRPQQEEVGEATSTEDKGAAADAATSSRRKVRDGKHRNKRKDRRRSRRSGSG